MHRNANTDDAHDAMSALLMVAAKSEERSTRMAAAFDAEIKSIRSELVRTQREISRIVEQAGGQISQISVEALKPVTARYEHAVAGISERVRQTRHTLWIWFAITAAALLLLLITGWAVLGYYRSKLADTRQKLQQQENVAALVRAFNASDAQVCEGRLCITVDEKAARYGDKRQYRMARSRPSP